MEEYQQPQAPPEPDGTNLPSTGSERKDGWTIANLIAIASVIVSGFLFYFTYKLYEQAYIQSQAATKSSEAAAAAVNEYKKANQTAADNYELAKNSFESSNVDSRKRFQLDSNSTHAQLNTLKRQFEISNEPFLEISHAKIDTTIGAGEPFRIIFRFENHGNYPVRVVDFHSGFITCGPPFNHDSLKYNLKDSVQYFNSYISKDKPLECEVGDTLSLAGYQWMVSQGFKNLIVYYFGYVKYSNLLNGHDRVYKFRLDFDCKPGASGDFIVNDNVDDLVTDMKHLGLF
jgi:hypothetical protein